MKWFETRRVVLTGGVGTAPQPLVAFDNALRDGGIADFNLIKVTSIVPPGIPVTRLPSAATPVLGQGAMVPTIYSDHGGEEIGQEIAAGVAVGIPTAQVPEAGLVYVWSGNGVHDDAEKELRAMVGAGMEARKQDKYETRLAIAATKIEAPWTTVVAAAFFCDEQINGLFRPSDVQHG
jgi:arginine decarboxylase